jgi:hypothetical protein
VNTFESASSAVSSPASTLSVPSSRPASDDGAGFAVTLVLVVVALLLGAAALADFMNHAG